MKDKTMETLIKVFVTSNPIGRAIWEEAASFNRGVGLAMAKQLMEADGLHSNTFDGYVDYMQKNQNDHELKVTMAGFKTYDEEKI